MTTKSQLPRASRHYIPGDSSICIGRALRRQIDHDSIWRIEDDAAMLAGVAAQRGVPPTSNEPPFVDLSEPTEDQGGGGCGSVLGGHNKRSELGILSFLLLPIALAVWRRRR